MFKNRKSFWNDDILTIENINKYGDYIKFTSKVETSYTELMVGEKYKEKLNEKINFVAKIFLGIDFVKAENSY